MTVSYSYDLSTISAATAIRLMAKWRGSVFKILFSELMVYFVAYLTISVSYRFAMPPESQLIFEKIVKYCQKFSSMIPVTFILGFYVSIVFTRWTSLLNSIAWPDKVALQLSQYLTGGLTSDEKRKIAEGAKCKMYRRTVIRYMVLAEVMVLRNISMQVKKRFPTIKHLVDSGLLTEEEELLISGTDTVAGDIKHWMPIEWSMAVITQARSEQKITSDFLMQAINEKLDEFRSMLGTMAMHDWVNVPLIYTQIVTIAVWTYFLAGLLGNQYLIDLYVPCFAILQFLCLVGWLRVAQNMLNPLGEADDDFELNWIIDRNLQVGFAMVDDVCLQKPSMKLDIFVDEDNPELPHTEASIVHSNQMIKNSCADVKIDREDARVVPSTPNDEAHRSRQSSVRAKHSHAGSSIMNAVNPAIRRIQNSISRNSLRSNRTRENSDSESHQGDIQAINENQNSDCESPKLRKNSRRSPPELGASNNGKENSADSSPTADNHQPEFGVGTPLENRKKLSALSTVDEEESLGGAPSSDAGAPGTPMKMTPVKKAATDSADSSFNIISTTVPEESEQFQTVKLTDAKEDENDVLTIESPASDKSAIS